MRRESILRFGLIGAAIGLVSMLTALTLSIALGGPGVGDLPRAVGLAALASIVGAAFGALKAISARQRGASEDIAHHQDLAEEQLRRAWRVADAERVLHDDPGGETLDSEREPALYRIWLLRTGRLTPEQFAAMVDREAVLERLAADMAELDVLLKQDKPGLLAAWRTRFGSEVELEDLRRLLERLPLRETTP